MAKKEFRIGTWLRDQVVPRILSSIIISSILVAWGYTRGYLSFLTNIEVTNPVNAIKLIMTILPIVIIIWMAMGYIFIFIKKYRTYLKGWQLIENTGIFHYTPNIHKLERKEIRSYIVDAISEASTILILGATGYNTFAKEENGKAFLRDTLKNHPGQWQILLLKPGSEAASQRASSLGMTAQQYDEEIRKSIEFLKILRRAGRHITLKVYDQTPIWKMFIAGKYIWLQYYVCGVHVDETPIYGVHHHSDSSLYVPLYNVFMKKWFNDNNQEVKLD